MSLIIAAMGMHAVEQKPRRIRIEQPEIASSQTGGVLLHPFFIALLAVTYAVSAAALFVLAKIFLLIK